MKGKTLTAAFLFAAGCGGGGDGVMLVDHLQWEQVESADDPFDDRPDSVTCEGGTGWEDLDGEDTFTVETGLCDYVTVTQPSLVEVQAGDSLHVRVSHFELTSPDPGEAHVAVMLGSEIAWQERVEIPNESGELTATWEAESNLPAETPIYFHLHNHGANSWSFIELSVK